MSDRLLANALHMKGQQLAVLEMVALYQEEHDAFKADGWFRKDIMRALRAQHPAEWLVLRWYCVGAVKKEAGYVDARIEANQAKRRGGQGLYVSGVGA